ncbi:MAG: exo-beta-N-acetylmuramidase NamZ family protein [Longimicrobiales bacterium]
MRAKRAPQSFLIAALLVSAPTCAPPGEDPALEGPSAAGAQSVPAATGGSVLPGIEILLADSLHLVEGRRVGLITNHTGIDSQGVPSIDRLVAAQEVELVALYSPEHGIRGTEEGGDRVESGRDEGTGLPIHSLYGETRKPTPAMLEGVEVLLFDIQDVGARYYTYVSTMALGMEAAGEAGIPFVVLDRPNPIGGRAVQGTILDPAFSTFVGLYPVPMRHGMTVGELARMMVGEFGVGVDLTVVPAEGWRRGMMFPETGLPWVPPSPNMPSVESALHYPGTCLFEGTNISVGRGTDEAFQVVGAPWLDGQALADALTAYQIPGVRFEATRFTPREPGDGKFGGEEIGGVRLRATSPDYDPTLATLALLREIRDMSAARWEWRVGHFDRLAGTDRLRAGIEEGSTVEALRAGWDEALRAFMAKREPYLIYPE